MPSTVDDLQKLIRRLGRHRSGGPNCGENRSDDLPELPSLARQLVQQAQALAQAQVRALASSLKPFDVPISAR